MWVTWWWLRILISLTIVSQLCDVEAANVDASQGKKENTHGGSVQEAKDVLFRFFFRYWLYVKRRSAVFSMSPYTLLFLFFYLFVCRSPLRKDNYRCARQFRVLHLIICFLFLPPHFSLLRAS